jgi:hypothetical protein
MKRRSFSPAAARVAELAGRRERNGDMTRRSLACSLLVAVAIAAAQPAGAQTPLVAPSPSAASTPFPAPSAAVVAPLNAPVTIPFLTTDPLPLLPVVVNGHVALMMIDTGGGDLTLDPDFAAEAGVTLAAAGSGVFGGGKRAPLSRGTAERVKLGSVVLTGVPVVGLPTRQIPFFPGHKPDGVVGTLVLAHFLATIDYVHGALVLRPRSDSAAFEAALPASAVAVPMSLIGDHFIFVRGRINDGPEGLLNVDTGLAGGGVMPSRATVADSNIVLDEKNAAEGLGGGGQVRVVPFTASVTVGSRSVKSVPGLFTPDGDPYGIFPFPVRGSVSHEYFRDCALTFDFEAMRLVMQ